MIKGVKIKPLSKVADERGSIMHMMRRDDPEFKKFGAAVPVAWIV